MTLFESNSLYREKLTIWRVLSLSPLYAPLAEGRVWRWFAVNIPMDLGTGAGGIFTSDIDIIARLHDFPNSKRWIYKTWEVKVSLLQKDGSARSLKAGKTKRTLTQLKAYKEFGAASTTLLDIYVCEDGFLKNNIFPTKEVYDVSHNKRSELSIEGFGYQILPFEHMKEGDTDVGLFAPSGLLGPVRIQGKAGIDILSPNDFGHRQPFSRLADDLNEFFERQGDRPRKSFNQIVYCKNCRQLQLIDMKAENECPKCKDNFIVQT
jgi:hypothetical protein